MIQGALHDRVVNCRVAIPTPTKQTAVTACAAVPGSRPTRKRAVASDAQAPAKLTKRQVLQSLTLAPLLFVAPHGYAADENGKLKHLPINEVVKRLKRALIEDQYFVTGKVPREIFDDECVFSDPTQRTPGVKWYSKAVPTLFNPAKSRVDVIDIRARDDRTIYLKWRLEAQLNIPGLRFNIKPYTGSAVYTTNDDGLINAQKESWDISIIDSFVSTFIPSFGAPPAPPIEELVQSSQA